ncbi:MAG TPA: hypothetical protein VJ302_30390 [Blastocatellia bacterium]|nr:hypothetical protein [Blastocatellia bacterium]
MLVITIKSPGLALFNRVGLAVVLITMLALTASAQKTDPKDPQNAKKGMELLEQAIQARGGSRFLTHQTVTATGQYTYYDKGVSTLPSQFLDIIAYPDKERIEFGRGKKKNRKIQVNVGTTGWSYDGDAEVLKDQTDKQLQSHIEDLEYDLDRILRSGWKAPGVQVGFAGREETRPGERADLVLIQLTAERSVLLSLDRNTHLPINMTYERAGDSGLIKHEVRYNQYVVYDGVNFPNIIDFYRNGVQESRVNYQTVKLDLPVNNEVFVKPASAKAVK